ncbi:MAG: phospholipase D-like domain-containing protein [Candidatus Falkowbacteria bacterium]
MKFRKRKNIFVLSIAILALLFCLFFIAIKWLRPLLNLSEAAAKPAYTVKTEEPVLTQIYFTNENAKVDSSQLIIDEINRAQKTIEIAMYSFKSNDIRDALYKASERGVKVTLILDYRKKTENNIFLLNMPTNIKRIDVGTDNGAGGTSLMHHKFALIDRGEEKGKLIFGSFNWTQLQKDYDRSFFLLSANRELIKSFGREFDRLAGGEFSTTKLANKNYSAWDLNLKAANYNYNVWFSPGRQNGNIDREILNLISAAKKDIKIMVWDFTDKSLANEIIYRAKAGLKITIIADSLNFYNKYSVFNYLLSEKERLNLNNLEILSNDVSLQKNGQASTTIDGIVADESIDPFLHYHLIIIDQKKILFGTNNWSKGGSFFNDESAIETDDPKIINPFNESFDYNYSQGKIASSTNK